MFHIGFRVVDDHGVVFLDVYLSDSSTQDSTQTAELLGSGATYSDLSQF